MCHTGDMSSTAPAIGDTISYKIIGSDEVKTAQVISTKTKRIRGVPTTTVVVGKPEWANPHVIFAGQIITEEAR